VQIIGKNKTAKFLAVVQALDLLDEKTGNH
jgi:hypothetical protein